MHDDRALTIAHISDLHFGAADKSALEDAAETLNRLAPDCIIASGDITNAGRRAEFATAKAWFFGLQSPVVACPGNHDAPVFALHRRFTAPFARFAGLALASSWRCPEGKAAVQAFNSARGAQWRLNWSHGVYGAGSLDAALACAAAGAPQGWRVIACHHPPVTPLGSPMPAPTRRGQAALQRLRDESRTLLLCGHVHAPIVQALGAAVMITAPTLASPRRRGHGNGFCLLRLVPEQATVEFWLRTKDGFGLDRSHAVTAP